MKNEALINEFVEKLKAHALQKEGMYDDVDKKLDTKYCLALAAEELGEVSAAYIRSRYLLSSYESIDLAHCAMLIWISLQDDVK